MTKREAIQQVLDSAYLRGRNWPDNPSMYNTKIAIDRIIEITKVERKGEVRDESQI